MSEEVQFEPVIKARSTALPHLCWSTRRNFLAGFVPMWLRARAASSSLVETEHQLMIVRMQSSLASAAIDARRGDYEPARQAVSQFFRPYVQKWIRGILRTIPRPNDKACSHYLPVATSLSPCLPGGILPPADRLADLFVTYRKIMSG